MNPSEFSPSNSPHMSDDVRALMAALLNAEEVWDGVEKTSENSHKKYKYAKLKDIYAALRPGLRAHRVKIWHGKRILEDGREIMVTRLIHAPTGQWVEDEAYIVTEMPGNQGIGSANTYMKKEGVLSLCGFARDEDEDDDGQGEQNHIEEKKTKYAEPSSQDALCNQEQLDKLVDLINKSKNPKFSQDKVLEYNKVKELSDLTVKQCLNAIKFWKE
jgi:hypothetical protein